MKVERRANQAVFLWLIQIFRRNRNSDIVELDHVLKGFSMNPSHPFEIHVHAEIPIRHDVTVTQVEEALQALMDYNTSKLCVGSDEGFGSEGDVIAINTEDHVLIVCWTTPGDMDVISVIEEICINLNDLARAGAPLEVSFYDMQFDDVFDEDEYIDDDDDDEDDHGYDSSDSSDTFYIHEGDEQDMMVRDDFMLFYVGPSNEDIMKAKRDVMVDSVAASLLEQFTPEEAQTVIDAIDKVYAKKVNETAIDNLMGRWKNQTPTKN